MTIYEKTGKGSDNDQTISDIIRGMQHAVNTAQEILQDNQFRLMEKYFNKDGSPIMRFVVLPDGRKIDIPAITLVPSNLLAIKELEMDFSVKVASTLVKSFDEKMADDSEIDAEVKTKKTKRSSFSAFFRGSRDKDKEKDGKDPDLINIRMKFASIDEPEASARIREMLYNRIQ